MNVVVYTRQECPLCEKGIADARTVFGEESITLVDIDLDLVLMAQYNDRVPVIETEDGLVVDEGIISEKTLRAFLNAF